MENVRLEVISRRQFVLVSGAAALAGVIGGIPTGAHAASEKFMDAMDKLLGKAEPEVNTKVHLTLPEVAPNGNSVPIRISVDSPMSETDHVKVLHILGDGNPVATTASFRFTVRSGRAEIATRIRLARSQNVVAIAEMSDGKLYLSKSLIKVTVGGCGS